MNCYALKRIGLVLVAAGLASACTPTGRLQVTTEKSENIPPGASASLNVSSNIPLKVSASANQEEWEKEEEEARIQNQKDAVVGIRNGLTKKLTEDGIFKAVRDAGEPAEYKLDVEIYKIRAVSPEARE